MSQTPMHLPDLGEIHDQYLALATLARERGTLGGSLLLRVGFDAEGISVLIASGLAGAAALCVDPEPELLREGLRHGLCDFLVADLSEALRILKNEIRKQRAVLVCVAAAPDALLIEIVERGVQPDLISHAAQEASSSFSVLRQRGASLVPAPHPDPGTERMLWSVETDAVRLLPQLAQIAAASLNEQRSDTPVRRHWLAEAPRWLGRSWAGRQCVRMTPDEAAAFTRQTRAKFPDISLAYDRRQA